MIQIHIIISKFAFGILRVMGYLLHSPNRSIAIFSFTMNALHFAFTSILMCVPLFLEIQYNILDNNDFWSYIGISIHISCCCTILVCLAETFRNREKHPIFIEKLAELNDNCRKSEIFERKLYKVIWKYLIITIIAVILAYHVMKLKYEIAPILAYFFVYSFSMMITRNFQFTVAIDLLKIHLEILNMKLEKQEYHKNEWNIEEILLEVKKTYEKIHDATTMINRYRGLSALFISTLYSVMIVGITYCRLVNFLKNVQIISNAEFILNLSTMLIVLLTTVNSCQAVSEEVNDLLMNIHKLGNKNLSLIQHISTQIHQNPIKFTAMGFYDINYRTLSSLLANSIMYIMILVQFDQTPKQDQMTVVDRRQNWIKFFDTIKNSTILNFI
uniref:Gustatory receptor n=1 Tax=Culicoides sonorensis TaxID=179676 RepID=A0A336N0E6_CULSO